MGEYYHSIFKDAFLQGLQNLVPDITKDDITSSPAGVRAQALSADDRSADDFVINDTGNMIHVINSPSPEATSSLSIGNHKAKIYSDIQ